MKDEFPIVTEELCRQLRCEEALALDEYWHAKTGRRPFMEYWDAKLEKVVERNPPTAADIIPLGLKLHVATAKISERILELRAKGRDLKNLSKNDRCALSRLCYEVRIVVNRLERAFKSVPVTEEEEVAA